MPFPTLHILVWLEQPIGVDSGMTNCRLLPPLPVNVGSVAGGTTCSFCSSSCTRHGQIPEVVTGFDLGKCQAQMLWIHLVHNSCKQGEIEKNIQSILMSIAEWKYIQDKSIQENMVCFSWFWWSYVIQKSFPFLFVMPRPPTRMQGKLSSRLTLWLRCQKGHGCTAACGWVIGKYLAHLFTGEVFYILLP